MVNPNSEFHIFRDSRRQARTIDLVARLRAALLEVPSATPLADILNLLLLAGELECALADAAAPAVDSTNAARLTSLIAATAVACDLGARTQAGRLPRDGIQLLNGVKFDRSVSIGTPEGFAYYALNPLDYADIIARLPWRARRAFVTGIRSIGTTLSAIVCAALEQRGAASERITVRPTGHPYERECCFDVAQQQAIARALVADPEFIVCDEGPGRSGSSLLSVAEALEREGVRTDRILLVCSHEPDVSALCTRNAAERWRRYRCAATGMTRRLPAGADCYAGGGEWRRHSLGGGEPWPAVWPQMERLKYLSSDGSELLTFEGHGPYGAPVSARNEALSQAGFGAHYLGHESGFGRHLLPSRRLLQCAELTSEMLTRMAEYCAWRARDFAASDADGSELANMVRTNLARELDGEPENPELRVERPAVCDNRMAPQHWLRSGDNRLAKLDAAIHGDDHFFPGPCDIAWDLAGVLVEWELSPAARDFLLSRYLRASGDNIAPRLHAYEVAYATFRLGWSRMAAASVAGSDEEGSLLHDARRYRRRLQRLTGHRIRQSPRPPASAPLPQAQETSAAPELP